MKKYDVFIQDFEGQGADEVIGINRIDGVEPSIEELQLIEKNSGFYS